MSVELKDAIKPVSASSLEANAAAVTYVRHLTALAAGSAAGSLRLEALTGFGFYFAACLTVSLLFVVLGGKPSRFFLSPWKALLWDGILAALPGYVLAWSLVYSLVET